MRRASVALPRLGGPSKLPSVRAYSKSASPPASPPANARLRFAPSPTGFLHLGGLRTALFNHLLARKWKGKWILRIEDTDQTRLVPGAVDSLRSTLEWAGLDYDEAGGSKGPYVQSERVDLYRHHAQYLLGHDHAYECFCSPSELQEIRVQLVKQGHRHAYDGRCRHLTDEDRTRRKQAGHKYVVRFKDPINVGQIPADLIYGDVQFPPLAAADDFVLLKSDGWPTYHLASVVDDHAMEISHVLRGEEWLPSVPKHHALYRAFGWTPPGFAHLPLLVNADGTKLSKRTGDVRVEHYRDKGYEPEALLNFLALMGWDHHSALEELAQRQQQIASASGTSAVAPAGGDESLVTSSTDIPDDGPLLPPQTRADSHSYYDLFTPGQLIAAFSIEHINHRKAAVNMSKLDFINKLTLRRKAGRLGDDGVLVEKGKEGLEAVEGQDGAEEVEETMQGHEQERAEMVTRLQGMLREQKVLKGNALVEDLDYVEKVFDAELARTVLLKDMSTSSIFFFLDPDFSAVETSEMLKTVNPVLYVEMVEHIVRELEKRLSEGTGVLTEDFGWAAINSVLRENQVQARMELLTPMRHALTGRRKGPSVPAVMAVLGARRTLDRLEAGLVHVRQLTRGSI